MINFLDESQKPYFENKVLVIIMNFYFRCYIGFIGF
jgi:hypothetical protein